jgi:hypothetical protein
MKTLHRLMLTILSGLILAACTPMPNPYYHEPWIGPNGQIVQAPPEGWPDYTKGAGSDMGGGRN